MPRPPKSPSPKQLAANRANAAHSTGPKTPEGKARSACNAVKHGFTAAAFAVVRLEDSGEIDRLKADLVSVYQPVNSQEIFALERMALAQQAILRAARLESGLFTTCLNETLDAADHPFTPMSKELAGDGDIEVTRAQNRNYCLAEGFLRTARQSNGWSLFLRYQAQAERQYRRALEEFNRLQSLRPDLAEEPFPNEPISPAFVGQVGNLPPGPEGAPRTRPVGPSTCPPNANNPVCKETPPHPVGQVSNLRPVYNRPAERSSPPPHRHRSNAAY